MRTDIDRAGNDDMIVARNDEEIDTMTVVQLKDELRRRKLKTTGNKIVLIERLCAAIILDGQKDDETEDDDEEQDNSAASGKSEDHEDDNRRRQQESARSNKACILTFKDVENSIDTFSGDDGRNIKQWIRDFDETASLCQWNEVQKTIYAKDLLRGSARLFIKYETRGKTWKDIKLALEKEFSLRIDSYDVHKQLMTRRKRNDETYYEYCYRMLEISSHANVETSAVIQYIIDGIVDDEVNKVILYGAKNISELKHKLDIYEIMKTKSRQNNKDDSLYAEIDKLDSKKCFNYDGKNHISATCLAKEKSTKCFKCGHIAANAMGTSTKVVDVNKIDIVDDVNKVDLTYVCNQTCRDELKELKEIIANYQLSEVTREKEELHLKLERMAWEDNARKGLELIEKWEKLNLEKESFAQERHKGWYKQISTLLQKSSDEIPEMRKTEEAACQESAQTAIVAVLEKEVENSKVLVADYKNQMEEMNMKIQSMEAELQQKTRQLIKHKASTVNLESFGRQLKDTIAEEYKFKYDDMQVQMLALKEDKASIEEAFRTLDNKNKELLEVIKEKDAATATLQERFQDTIESLETRLQNEVENLTMKERKIADLEAVIDNKDHELHTKHAQLQNDSTIDSLRDELNDCTMKLKKSEEVASLVSLKRTLGLNDLIKKREKEIKILKDTLEMNRLSRFRSSDLNYAVYQDFTREKEQAEIKYNELQNEHKSVLKANDTMYERYDLECDMF